MSFELMASAADPLARSRRTGYVCDLPLDKISSGAQAEEIQKAALDALGFERRGYAIVGSSEASRRTLDLSRPIVSEVPASAYHVGRKALLLPPNIIGAQCELAFTMLRSYPDRNERIDRWTAADAVLSYQPAIGILGYRTLHRYPGDYPAIADFGLHVATICGSHTNIVDPEALSEVDVTASLSKNIVAKGSMSTILGHPLEALVWLARKLVENGHQLQPGDIITTGSCTTILQVMSGQHMSADFGAVGRVECTFM